MSLSPSYRHETSNIYEKDVDNEVDEVLPVDGATAGNEDHVTVAHDATVGQLRWKCDNCRLRLVGQCAVYVCVQCPHYRICSACATGPVHEHHYMLRIPAHRSATEVEAVVRNIRDHTNTNHLYNQRVKLEIKAEPCNDPLNVEQATADNMNSDDGNLGLTVSEMEKDFLFDVGYDGRLIEKTHHQGEVNTVVDESNEHIVPSELTVRNDDDFSPESELPCPVVEVGHNVEVQGRDPVTSNVDKRKWIDNDVQLSDDTNCDKQVIGEPGTIIQLNELPLKYIMSKRICLGVDYIDDLDCYGLSIQTDTSID